MTLRRLFFALALAVLAQPGSATAASYETTNFVVEAPSPDLAKRFGDMAEKYRHEKAMEWLGREMPPWNQKCPLRVSVNMGGAGGATTFNFGQSGGRPIVVSQQMEIHGDLRQLLYSVLPHEVTHTVLAHHFGRPVPRWADEGGSVLSENENERDSHDRRCRELLNLGRGIHLSTLFRLAQYPRDMIVLYAQGYSVTAYLVEKGGGGTPGRTKLLSFLAQGMQGSTPDAHGTPETWNAAAHRVYGFPTCDALEAAWIDSLRTPPTRTASRNAGNPAIPTGGYAGASRAEVRASGAPALPILEPPVRARGVAPDNDTGFRGTASFPPAGGSLPPRSLPPRSLPPSRVSTPTAANRPTEPPVPVLLPPEIPRATRP